jgi:hypothetical protein
MRRGSKPGERRGGRQRATPNKRTVLTDRIVAIASVNPTASCDELVAFLVKDQAIAVSSRLAIARKWFADARSRSAHARSRKGNAANARESQATERPAPLKADGGAANITPLSTTRASPHASTTTNLAMLPILLSIVQDSATQPAERRKAAAELAQYFLPKKPSQKKSRRGKFAADQYGFVVDPDVAQELRDTKLELAGLSKRKFTPHALANRLAQTAVLELKLLQAFHLLDLQPTKFLAPAIVGHLAHADLAGIASAMLCPCDVRTSTCRSFATISSAL